MQLASPEVKTSQAETLQVHVRVARPSGVLTKVPAPEYHVKYGFLKNKNKKRKGKIKLVI
jgi:hypothetical protein